LKSRGNNNFPEKRNFIRNFGGWKSDFFLEKVKLVKLPMASEKFSEIGKKSKTEGNASLPQRG